VYGDSFLTAVDAMMWVAFRKTGSGGLDQLRGGNVAGR